MAKKTTGPTHETIIRDVRAGHVAPVYYLMGEESYYIDRIADFLVDTLLPPAERDFNLVSLFGAEVNTQAVRHAAQAYPMGAERQVVLVREAQHLKDIDRLEPYLKNPQPASVLILCHMNGVLDRRKAVAKLIEQVGVLYESPKLRDYALPGWIVSYAKRKRIAIEPAASELMAAYIGADLNRMASELDKLIIALPSGQNTISQALVTSHIGVSKEFNVFELTDALGRKDVFKVNQIADYFERNPKKNPIQMVLPALFRYFSNLMLAYYAPQKTKQGIATWVGVTEWQAERNILPAMSRYTARKVMEIIGEIRKTDARSKGVENPSISAGDLMKELLFFILH